MVGRILTTLLHAAGVVLFFLGGAGLVRWLGRRNPKILLYHDCAPAETEYTAGLNCTTDPEKFEKHLTYLRQHYELVDVQTILAGKAPPKAAAVTFDDGYASVYANALPALRANGIPATVYLISSVVDNEALVWVNELNSLLHRGGPEAIQIVQRYFEVGGSPRPADIINICRLNYHRETIDFLLEELRDLLKAPMVPHAQKAQLYLSWDQIHEMRDAGVEFGNHSRTHPNMERLTEAEQAAEIEAAQRELSERLSNVRAFAHPFGHHGAATATIASSFGLESVAEVGGHNSPLVPLELGRIHIANESIAGLFARMEVVEPVKARLRRLLHRPNNRRSAEAA